MPWQTLQITVKNSCHSLPPPVKMTNTSTWTKQKHTKKKDKKAEYNDGQKTAKEQMKTEHS